MPTTARNSVEKTKISFKNTWFCDVVLKYLLFKSDNKIRLVQLSYHLILSI